MNLNEILESLKRDYKIKKKILKRDPRLVGNCLVYDYQFLTLNSNFETTTKSSKFPISINLTNPLIKTIYCLYTQKSAKNLQNSQKCRSLG